MLHRHGGRPGERRTGRRFARRAQVEYWVRGEPRPRRAFINDLSNTGVFIATPYPLPRDTQIRLEIYDGESSYTVEAVVARRVWIAPDLRKLGPTGMGARFLTPEEIVDRLRRRGEGRVGGTRSSEDHFRIVLDDDQDLLQIYARDLELGSLFIPTDQPSPLNREIEVEFEFPGGQDVLGVRARVVQRIPADQDSSLQAGMAVVFEDKDELLARLRPYLQTAIPAGPATPPSPG